LKAARKITHHVHVIYNKIIMILLRNHRGQKALDDILKCWKNKTVNLEFYSQQNCL